jgi:hypothetical protein
MALHRIDNHFHIVPDFLAQAVEETGGGPSGWKPPAYICGASLRTHGVARYKYGYNVNNISWHYYL